MAHSEQLCGMCGKNPAKFASIVAANSDYVRMQKPLCETCAAALGKYIDSIVERVAKATEESEIMFATARALEVEADRFVAYRSSTGIGDSVDSLLDTLGVRHG